MMTSVHSRVIGIIPTEIMQGKTDDIIKKQMMIGTEYRCSFSLTLH
jgi:hypothetical protein